ncbi:MAG: bifunctional metallophosphatase/5'-nucleotidase [Clostridia bacterium]|nr:bifunctional metallophosphatase/5'-nucleotidase [Clostridia bacterium]
MNTRKILSLAMASVMTLSASAAFADMTADEYAAAAVVKTELNDSYEGKTVILHSNDVHGAIGGYAYIAALEKEFSARGAGVILADAGDYSQGTTYVSTSKGSSAVMMMNEAGYDVATLGNHEFDYGYEQLMLNLADAKFTPVCCNVILDETGLPILAPYCVVANEGAPKIAFVGVETPETATKVNPGLIKEIHFTAFDELYTTVQGAVDKAREEADLVIGLFHLGVDAESAPNGYRSLDVLAKVNGIDFVIDGHSHTTMTAGENGEPIQSTGTAFANIGVIVIDNATKQIEDNFLMPTTIGVYSMPKDEEVKLAADAVIGIVDALYGKEFATTEVDLNGDRAPGNRTEETNLGDLITDAMVWSVAKEGGAEQDEPFQMVGITNGGGIRASIPAGGITMNQVHTVLPFGNTVAVVYVTGAELLEALEASTYCTPDAIGGFPQTSGIDWTLDTTKAYDQGAVYVLDGKESSYYAPASIQRVTITAINGEPFDPEAVYAVVTNNFCSAGGDTYNVFANAGNSFDTSIPMDLALMDYITEALNGVITEEAYGQPRGNAVQILAAE